MNLGALAHLLTILTLTLGFAANRDAIAWRPNRAEVIEVMALADGTALVTQRGDAGSFLSRMKPDGSRIWIARVPGEIFTHALASNDSRIAVRYEDEESCDVATFTLDGQSLWTHRLSRRDRHDDCYPRLLTGAVFASDVVAVWTDSGIIGLSTSDGSERWQQHRRAEETAELLPDGTIALQETYRQYVLDPHTGEVSAREGCQLGHERLILHSGAPHDEVLGDRGFASTLPFGKDSDRSSELLGCATYRDQIALLILRQDETRLVLTNRAGYVLADHHLPVVEAPWNDLMGAVPASRLSFRGELPRIIPLVARVDVDSTPMLVDVETGEVVARANPDLGYHAVRDGEAAFFVQDFGHSLLELSRDDQVLRPRATRLRDLFRSAQLGGGYIWTFDEDTGRLDKPPVTATPALPRRV